MEMRSDSTNLPSETFVRELRSALNHLFDPDFLRKSPLVGILGVGERFDTPSALQAILNRAIEALKPRPCDPQKAHAQAIYDLLLYRYIQQFNQDEIANQLGISVRHLRRQQNLAIITFLGSWNSFLWPLVILRSEEMMTLPIGLARLTENVPGKTRDFGVIMAAATLVSVPVIAVFMAMQRQFISGLLSGSVKQ